MTVWDVPTLKVPHLTAADMFIMDPRPIVLYDNGRSMEIEFTDSDSDDFGKDLYTAKTSLWVQQVFTRHVPAASDYAKPYVHHVTGIAQKK